MADARRKGNFATRALNGFTFVRLPPQLPRVIHQLLSTGNAVISVLASSPAVRALLELLAQPAVRVTAMSSFSVL